MTRSVINSYDSYDETGYRPDLSRIYKVYTHVKTGNIYVIEGYGFNAKSQRWEYRYKNMDGLVFHREPAVFHQIEADGEPKFKECASTNV